MADLTPLQALHNLLARWDFAAAAMLRASQDDKAKHYAQAIMACHKELFEMIDGLEDDAIPSKAPMPHEMKVQ